MEGAASIEVASADLPADIEALESNGFRLELIFPADAPRVAELAVPGVRLRLDTASGAAPASIAVPGLAESVVLSGGTSLKRASLNFEMPPLDDAFVLTSGGDWGVGRAGMQYRDLIPERHGGRAIASHIRIAEPGPVPDYVHHHDIRFQMIFCRRGRVRLVYEDFGEPFWMSEGDCVLQPPNIRHRVLESADGLEVVEIASPAAHPTFIEHEMDLPNGVVDPERVFGGQRFSFDRADDLAWESIGSGWEARTTGIRAATDGVGSVRTIRPTVDAGALAGSTAGDLCMFFVLSGSVAVVSADHQHDLAVDDSVAIESGQAWELRDASSDFTALHVEISAA